jgi:protein-L-isoaspartate O-methyltransferase
VANPRPLPTSLSAPGLAELIEHGDGSDRAFVDAVLRMEWARNQDPGYRAKLAELHAALQANALRSHAALRQEITQGRVRASGLRRQFDDVSRFERDHFVEEVLGIAYPPLEERALVTSEHMTYSPSGYDEIVHAFELTQLGPGDRFLDLGSGLGKVVMLAALLTGAQSAGVECDSQLCERGRAAAAELAVPRVQVRLGDARETSSANADVVFMYLPFGGDALARVMDRLLADGRRPRTRARRRFLCTGPLDPARYPELVLVGAAKYWLHVYGWR